MRYVAVAALALAVLVVASHAPVGGEEESESGVEIVADTPAKAEPAAGHEVWEARVLLLTPGGSAPEGVDLRLRHLLGDEASGERVFTVAAEPDPETLVSNLRKLGTVEVLERAIVPVLEKRGAGYQSSAKIPVPQVETRRQQGQENSFVRMKFEEIGTTLQLQPRGGTAWRADLRTSFLLGTVKPYGYPLVAQAKWEVEVDVPTGRTAVLRGHYRLPGALLSYGAGGLVDSGSEPGVSGTTHRVVLPRTDLGRVLVVLLTHSRLP